MIKSMVSWSVKDKKFTLVVFAFLHPIFLIYVVGMPQSILSNDFKMVGKGKGMLISGNGLKKMVHRENNHGRVLREC